nr:MAG: hypothetical protein [Bacteriophage sp.]
MRKYVIIAFAVLLAATAFLSYRVRTLQSERDRLQNNQTALLDDVAYYKTESGKYAASVQSLELSKSELQEHCNELVKTVEDLNIKIKRIQSVSETATKTEVPIKTEVRDSIVYRNPDSLSVDPARPIIDTLKRITFKDPWVELDGTINKNIFTGKIQTVDTLIQVIHRVPHQWWFFKWGTKAIKQEIRSSNPYTKIVYTEYIELKRKNKK